MTQTRRLSYRELLHKYHQDLGLVQKGEYGGRQVWV